MAKLIAFPKPVAVKDSRGKTNKVALTESRIEELEVTGATYYVNDSKQPGLSVRVSAGGVRAFIFTKFKQGKLIRLTLGRVGALRLNAARLAAQKLHGELALGVDIATRRPSAAVKPETMQEAFERFMELKTRRPKTSIDYEYLWRLHVPAALKRKPVKDVTPADLQGLVRNLGEKHRTANKVIVLIKSILNKSGRWAENPAREIVRFAEHPRTRRLNIEELSNVWKAIENEKEWGDFFRLLILTGARRSAFCAMKWENLNLDMGVWAIPVTWSKSKRELAVPLSNEAVKILKARKERMGGVNCQHLDWVWPSANSGTGHVVNPEDPWRRILKSAGIQEYATLHDIRRTLGSRLAMGGVAGATISKVLGHLSPQSLRSYVHLDISAGKEAIEQVFAPLIASSSAE
jgi:integrase